MNLLIVAVVVETLCRLNRTMTLRIPSADVSLLDSYDRSLTSEGPELTRRPTFDGDIPPVEDTNAGLTEELPVPGTKQERTCGTCGKDTIEYSKAHGNYVRCKHCIVFQGRMQSVFTKNEGLRKAWNNMSPSARRVWNRCRAKHAIKGQQHLAKAIAAHIQKSGPTWDDIKPCFQKSLCDSPELKRRYRGKNRQLQNLKRRTAKVFDERRQCFLYEDYVMRAGSLSTLKRKVDTARVAANAAIAEDEDEMHAAPLSRLKTKLEEAAAAAEAAIAKDEQEIVPPAVRQVLIRKNNELERMSFEIDHLVAKGEYSHLDTMAAESKTMWLIRTHAKTLMTFGRLRKSIQNFVRPQRPFPK